MNNKSRHFDVISVHFEKHHSSSFNNIEIKIYQTERMLEDIQCPKPLKNERKRKKEREKINVQQRKNLNCWVGTKLLIIKNLENK